VVAEQEEAADFLVEVDQAEDKVVDSMGQREAMAAAADEGRNLLQL
jgi:hypothetical protein